MTAATASALGREAARLAEVRRYCILDTEPESDFDAIVALAAEICGTPVSLITIVDQNRQWFKARLGFALDETSRDLSFCSRAIEHPDEMLVVDDAANDPRFARTGLVTGPPYMKFYAGVPINSPDGFALGALCVIDTVPRSLSAAQKRALKTLASQAMAQLELRRILREGRERKDALDASRLSLRERTLENELLRYANDHDALTGLLSRARFERAVADKARASRDCASSYAVIVLDIDDFHEVNESYGVEAGNALLRAVATAASALAPGAILGRLYADTFGLLVEFDDPSDVCTLAESLIRACGQPFVIDVETVWVSASAGIAYATDTRDRPTDLLADADTALKRAQKVRGDYRVYRAEMSDSSVARATIRDRLRDALAREHFELHYQPKIDLRTRKVVGCEALLRWQHPQSGSQSPATFVPVAEQTGLIVPIGEWVIREACRQYAAWRNEGVANVPIAINVSAAQFSRSNVSDYIEAALKDFDIPPWALEIEITEGMLLVCSDDLIAKLQALHCAGIGIALDDFGTGFSSLGYLHRLPLSLLKVDQSFVRGALSNKSDAAIVKSVVHLARQLGLRTVAEGVETIEQLAFVTESGCDEAQGYYFSPPLAAEDFKRFVRPIQTVPTAV